LEVPHSAATAVAAAPDDWCKPAEWFKGKLCTSGPIFEVDELEDGTIRRVKVEWIDDMDVTGEVWVTPAQLKIWAESTCTYDSWLTQALFKLHEEHDDKPDDLAAPDDKHDDAAVPVAADTMSLTDDAAVPDDLVVPHDSAATAAVTTLDDWRKPAEWFVGKTCRPGWFKPEVRDGKVIRVEVLYGDSVTHESGDVWIAPEQLEAWPSAARLHRAWLVDWALAGMMPQGTTAVEIAAVASLEPAQPNHEEDMEEEKEEEEEGSVHSHTYV
jgi:hypothetical protein